jgi:capsid assembly protease
MNTTRKPESILITNTFLTRFADQTPALVSPDNQARFESCLNAGYVEMERIKDRMSSEPVKMSSDDDFWYPEDSWVSAFQPYVVKEGVLQIPVKGVLIHDFAFSVSGWMTGYDYIWQCFKRGMADANVKGIALIVDSPGGEVAGCFDCADKMYEMRGTKPVIGFAAESAYSAAYAIISVGDKINVSRTGGVGSIGVLTSHVDMSAAMDKYGYKITFIYAGKHKVDGNPYEALPADVKARIQARIDDLYSVFVSSVARNRGMDEKAVRETEALTFTASQAVSNGLADSIGALDDSLADFSATLNPQEGDYAMADVITQAQLDEAVAAAASAASTTARAEGVAEGTKAGATAEKARIVAILNSDVGKARPSAALAAALETDLTPEQADAFLGKLPVEGQTATTGSKLNAFVAAMDAAEHPNVDANVSAVDTAADADGKDIAELAKAYGLTHFKTAA